MPDLAQAALVAAGGAFAGAGVWQFLGKWLGVSWQRRESEAERLRREIAEERARNDACEERVNQLERRLEAVEHHQSSLVPRWIEDVAKRIIWVNDAAMMQIFAPLQLTRVQVEGHTFRQLLGPAAATETERLDRAALANPSVAVSSLLTLHPSLRKMHIAKVAGVGRERELIFEGYAYSVNSPEVDAALGGDRKQEQGGLSALRMAEDRDEGGE